MRNNSQGIKEHSIGGVAGLKIIISPRGNVEKAELLGGNPVFGDAAVVKWKYPTADSRTLEEVSILFGPNR